MEKIKNLLMLFAVMLSITGAFAFSNPQKNLIGGTVYGVASAPTYTGGTTITFTPANSGNPVTGIQGEDYFCNTGSKPACTVKTKTTSSFSNNSGVYTITDAIIVTDGDFSFDHQ